MMILIASQITMSSSFGFGWSGYFGNDNGYSSSSSDSSEDTITMDTIDLLRNELIPFIDQTGLGNSGIPNIDRFKEDKHPMIGGLV